MSTEIDGPRPQNPTGELTTKRRLRRLGIAAGVTLAGVAFAGLAAGGIAGLHWRAAADPQTSSPPAVAVSTIRAKVEPGYDRTATFTGRLEASRQTPLAFERAGLVVAVTRDEGDEVKAGDTVATLDTAQLRVSRQQLEARRRELEAQRQLAELTLGRQSQLSLQGWSADQRRDEAQATVSQLGAAIEQVQAQLASLDVDLSKSKLVAPFDGRVGARTIDDGAVVAAGTPVLTLIETSRPQARIGLPPDVARMLDERRTYTLRSGGRALSAKIVARRPDLETGTRTLTVLFELVGNTDATLGDLVTLELPTRIEERGAWLPIAALKEGRRGLWTILVLDDPQGAPRVRSEAVEVLDTRADQAFVRGTFRDGDHVIKAGTSRVIAGQRVALAAE